MRQHKAVLSDMTRLYAELMAEGRTIIILGKYIDTESYKKLFTKLGLAKIKCEPVEVTTGGVPIVKVEPDRTKTIIGHTPVVTTHAGYRFSGKPKKKRSK